MSIHTIAVIAAAFVAGGLLVVSLGIVRATLRLELETWWPVHRALDRTIGPYLGGLVIVSLGLAIAAASWSLVLGLATVLAISLAVNVPINRAVARWDRPPADWERIRARWNRYQHARAAAAVIAAVLGAS